MGTAKGDSTPERASWSNPIEFVLSCWTYAVGLGNVWRFPYLCYRNGGGVFLIVYIVMLFLMGMPIFLLELVVGQYSGLGPDQAFSRLAPIFSGLGYCCLTVVALIIVYYMVIIAWTVFYFFASFTSELGFGSCMNGFNSVGCFSAIEDATCDNVSTYFNFTCTPLKEICQNHGLAGYKNRTFCLDEEGNPVHISYVIKRTLATYEYFNQYVLGRGEATWDNFGTLRWQLVLCLLLSWIVCYFCVIRGVRSSGKAVYFTTLFPYIILTALVVQGALLEGAVDGILLFVTPNWEKLYEAEVWGMAASQTFYSFGIGCGSLVTLASYNNFQNNCIRDSLIVTAANIFTSIYAGFAIFAMIGFLAKQMDLPVEEVATDGPGLAFVAYPEAILNLPAPTFWAIVFFFMLFVLGLGSQFAGVEALNTALLDKWPNLRQHQWKVTLTICFTCFILAIPMCFQGGIYLFTLLEWNTASWAIMLIGLAEIVTVAYCLGVKSFLTNFEKMKMKLSCFPYWFWWCCFMFITPIALIGVFVFQMATYSPATYGNYVFPAWADALGILIGAATLTPMVIFAIYTLFQRKYRGWELLRPTKQWMSQLEKSESQERLDKAVSVERF